MDSTNSSTILPANCPGYETIYSFNTITLTTEIKSTWISLNVINGVAAPVIFALNLLIIWTILEKENLRTNKSNFLLAVLALTDILVGLLVQPINIWLYNCFLRDGCTVPCAFFKNISFIPRFLVLLSLTCLMMVSVERYIAVQRPFLYQNITMKKVVLSVIFNWSFLFVLSILNFVLRSQHNIWLRFEVVLSVFELLVTIFCTVRVQIAAYRQSRQIVAQAVAVLGQATEEQKQEHKKRYQETKKTKTMCLIVFSSFLMYFPILAVAIAKSFNALGDKLFIVLPVSITFGFLQSLVNPLITLRLSYIRRAVLRKLGKLFGFSIANEQ